MTPVIDDIDPTEDNPGTPVGTNRPNGTICVQNSDCASNFCAPPNMALGILVSVCADNPTTGTTSGTSGTAGTSGTVNDITPTLVAEALYVSASYMTVNYEKFVTQQIVDTEFGIANRAASFYIQAVPSSRQGNLLFLRAEDDKIINEQFPLLLPPLSKVVKIKTRINNTNVLNNTVTPSNSLNYDIYFKLVAVVEKPVPDTNTTGGIGGGTGATLPLSPDRFAVPRTDNTEL